MDRYNVCVRSRLSDFELPLGSVAGENTQDARERTHELIRRTQDIFHPQALVVIYRPDGSMIDDNQLTVGDIVGT